MDHTRIRAVPLVLLLCVLVTGCGSEDPSATSRHDRRDDPASTQPAGEAASTPPSDPSSAASASPAPPEGTRIMAGDSEFGPMLYDASGQPIYLFTAESGERPSCYAACAEDWPPVLTAGPPTGDLGVRAELLGTTRRADGSTQVTYGGHPLYFYAHEGKYEVLCHDVEEYGGTWLVVRPDGTPAPG